MSKPYTKEDLSTIFDHDLIWRRKELSDLKQAIKTSDSASKSALLKSLIAMSYSHWEGYIKFIAAKYFEYFTIRKKLFNELDRQFYVNSMLARLDSISTSRTSIEEKCNIINEILDNQEKRFSYVNQSLIDTRSNLNSFVISDICLICGISSEHFKDQSNFIDVLLLKRRNAIAHGQQEDVQEETMDDFVGNVLSLMTHFRDLLENKIYYKESVTS
jgi:RiboL-PSP-HEPN